MMEKGGNIVSHELTLDVFDRLRELITAECGILFPENKCASLEAKLSDHVTLLGLPGFPEYCQRLAGEAPNSQMWQEVFRRISTHETYFFRNTAQAAVFAEHLLPKVMERQEGKLFRRLKLWSAACSTGEEAYTMAMQVADVLGRRIGEWQPQILANDIDAHSIREAVSGRYAGRALQNVPRHYFRRYFTRGGDVYTVNEDLRSMITFKVFNFAHDREMEAQVNMDIIFCRNVLIYFDIAFRKRVVDHLYNSLKPGGYLVIGHSESLRGIHDGFIARTFPGTVVYQRPEV